MKVVKGLGCVCVLCVYVCVATTRVKSLTEGWILLGVQLPLCQVCFVDESSEGVRGGGGGGGGVCVCGDYSCEITYRGVDSLTSAATTVSGVFC